MLVLFELASGYAVFNVNDDGAIKDPEASWKIFDSQKSIKKNITVEAMHKFKSMTDAVASLNTVIEGKLSDDLSKFLGNIIEKNPNNVLAVADAKLGAEISKKLGVQVVADKSVINLYRGLREQLENILPDSKELLSAMSLGLSHSLSRHKLKFSIDKVDTMIIHSSGLLEDLDKEINTYAMRAKEWYGLHFPEMSKIVEDNLAYAKVIKTIGLRSDAQSSDLSSILPEELDKQVKEAAEVSMGSEITQDDLESISQFCDQIINLSEYRAQLHEYIRNRMKMMTPNLTTLVGELIGAKLISHAGGLTNLAKLPASTVQILGAEKAFFRAVKAKKSTPKYGILYHASLVGQASAKNKGKIARLVATKSSLSARADSFSEEKDVDAEMGNKSRKFIEKRLNILEKTKDVSSSTTKKKNSKMQGLISTATSYDPSADIIKESIQPMEICKDSDKSEESEEIVKMEIVEETQDGESKADEQEESAEIKGSTKDKKKDKKIKKEKKKFKANEQEESIKSKSLSKKGKEKSKTDEQEETVEAKSSSKKSKEKTETGEQEEEPVKAKSSGKKGKEKPETGEQEEALVKAKSSGKKGKEKPETGEQEEEPVKAKSSGKKGKEKPETSEKVEEPVKAKSSSKKSKEKSETGEQEEEPVKAKSSSKKGKEKPETGEQEEEPVKAKSSSKKSKEKSETGEQEEEPVKAKSPSKKNKEKSKADEQEESAKVKSSNKKRKAKSKADEQEESVEAKLSSKKRKEEFDIQEESAESKPSSKKGKEKSKNDEQEESVKSSSKKDKEESKSSSKKDKSGKVKTEKKESVQIADVEEHGETSKTTKRKHDGSDEGKDDGKDDGKDEKGETSKEFFIQVFFKFYF
ncbi:9767_t:CDS:2 [Entrophospora sp. SA101]|nr:9767_t:CDS:2 [Entrophospora sp. SA101]